MTDPGADEVTAGRLAFVLHEHRRPQHHFDLRLEEGGVLRSWAVPRGLPEETGRDRLAVAVPDHALDHLRYEDADKSIADIGWWEEHGRNDRRILFTLHGRHAARRYALIRTPQNWLLHLTKEQPMSAEPSRARVDDVRELALGMPHVTVSHGPSGNPVYQVGGKSFVFFRTPRPDATDPETGERYPDVIVFWVSSESEKQALVQDPASPFFTTPHFDGHSSVLVRASRIGELTRQELAEVVEEAWLAQASQRRRAAWLAAHDPEHQG